MEDTRPATAADVPVLVDLARAAVDEQRDARGGSIWSRREVRVEPLDESFRAALAADDHLVRVGTIDDTPVGYVVAHLEPLRDGAILGVVDDVYVDPGARGVGVGEALIDPVVAWCRERGAVGIDALALPGNRATKNFFETFGFTARAIVVHRSLEPDDGS